MSNLEQLRDRLPEFAKDTRLNLGAVINASGHPGLSETQVLGIALASAYASFPPSCA